MELMINRIEFMAIFSKFIGYQEGINTYLGNILSKYMKQKISS
jgi:amino acid permease